MSERINHLATVSVNLSTRSIAWTRWLPLLVLPATALAFQDALPTWAFMWLMVLAIFGGFKWLTYCYATESNESPSVSRSLGYLLGSLSMDAEAFLAGPVVHRPKTWDWGTAALNTSIGCILLWGVARWAVPWGDELTGWIGLAGIAFLLHFGLFHLWSLAWRTAGVECRHIMHSPARATSVSDFWGNRWNLAFNDIVYRLVFRKLLRKVGMRWSLTAVFLLSGILHELAISLPARGGYGLPTLYFLLQAVGALAERTKPGRRLSLGHGLRGWLWTLLVVAGPAYWLFHPVFVRNVIVPFMHAIGAV
jgi:hypothetical protein